MEERLREATDTEHGNMQLMQILDDTWNAEDADTFAQRHKPDVVVRWPGNASYSGLILGEPAFYAYIYPEPAGFKEARVKPVGAAYRPDFGEFVFPLEAARRAAAPGHAILEFFESTYEAAAACAGWDRATLERAPEHGKIAQTHDPPSSATSTKRAHMNARASSTALLRAAIDIRFCEELIAPAFGVKERR
jgi:hypothetical protein